ncbi:MAG: alpha-amylase family glycosyl hydrolase [Candidatus Wallbacteria bacterium]|nr:alpha-amylase family glycosyl hydrolase [Candidatus Wallbacteria bacterium]
MPGLSEYFNAMRKAFWHDTVFSYPGGEFLSPSDPLVNQEVTVRIRMAPDPGIEHVFLRTAPEGEEILQRMKLEQNDPLLEYYSASTKFICERSGYRFMIVKRGGELLHYNALGLHRVTPLDIFDFKVQTGRDSIGWTENSVFYQIFPDRFYSAPFKGAVREGEPLSNGMHARVSPWGELPNRSGGSCSQEFFNGNLPGIAVKLGYIDDLGCNAVYLNPVFTAPSNHRYDTTDYFSIDPHIGSNRVFSRLVRDMHHRGMRIILDGVFNHTGVCCPWFDKLGRHPEPGAYQDTNSRYSGFYTFHSRPDHYECWLGVKSLPKLDFRSRELRDQLYLREDSVMQTWLRAPFHVDGWRFDVANMLARQGEFQEFIQVWREISQCLKSANPEAYLMGEHFFDGTDLLRENCLDGLMNYQGFYFPLIRWLGERCDFRSDQGSMNPEVRFTGEQVMRQMSDFLAAIPWRKALRMYNLLGCHDRPRIMSVLSGNILRLKSAMIMLFSYVGVPAVYYGDEIGMTGKGDPDCRRCMDWDESRWDADLNSLYRKLIRLRRSSAVLAGGGIKWLSASEDAISFARISDSEAMVAVAFRSPQRVKLSLRQIGINRGKAVSQLTGEVRKISGGQMEAGPQPDLYLIKT